MWRGTSEASRRAPRLGPGQGRGGQRPVPFAHIRRAGAPHPGTRCGLEPRPGRPQADALHVQASASPSAECWSPGRVRPDPPRAPGGGLAPLSLQRTGSSELLRGSGPLARFLRTWISVPGSSWATRTPSGHTGRQRAGRRRPGLAHTGSSFWRTRLGRLEPGEGGKASTPINLQPGPGPRTSQNITSHSGAERRRVSRARGFAERCGRRLERTLMALEPLAGPAPPAVAPPSAPMGARRSPPGLCVLASPSPFSARLKAPHPSLRHVVPASSIPALFSLRGRPPKYPARWRRRQPWGPPGNTLESLGLAGPSGPPNQRLAGGCSRDGSCWELRGGGTGPGPTSAGFSG